MHRRNAKDERLHKIIAAGADPYLGKREYAVLRGVSVKTLDRLVAAGKIPKPELIGFRKLGWRLSTIQKPNERASVTAAPTQIAAEGRSDNAG